MPSNPINAPAGDFLTLASSGIPFEGRWRAITQLLSGELRAGAVKARRPRADHARGRSEATALHGAEHRSKLCCVMAGGLPVERGRCREAPDDGEIRVPDDITPTVNTRMTRGQL